MAPPANRRSSYSRRSQYTIFFSYFAGVVGVLLGLVLLVVSFVQPSALSGLRNLASDVTEPLGQVTSDARTVSKDAFSTVSGFLQAGSQHARLERELKVAKVRLVEARAIQDENRRLKGLLGLAKQEQSPIAVTQLTSSTASSTRRYATLGSGQNKGIQNGMPVRSELGLLGRVLEVAQTSARILLITDTESLVPVRRYTDGVPAFAQGTGDGNIHIKLISLGINPLKKGDVFVTSGSGGLYRPGTPTAIVREITTDGALAQVLANPSDSDYVIVEQTFAQTPPPEGNSLPVSR